MRTLRRLAKPAFYACLAGALLLALLPQPPSVGTPSDKVNHMIAFVTLGLLAPG